MVKPLPWPPVCSQQEFGIPRGHQTWQLAMENHQKTWAGYFHCHVWLTEWNTRVLPCAENSPSSIYHELNVYGGRRPFYPIPLHHADFSGTVRHRKMVTTFSVPSWRHVLPAMIKHDLDKNSKVHWRPWAPHGLEGDLHLRSTDPTVTIPHLETYAIPLKINILRVGRRHFERHPEFTFTLW